MHLGGPHMTQNQGNVLGDRPCVRQSRLYREQVGGNTMKDLLGQETLKWDTNQTEGAYSGGRVYDHINQQYETGPRQAQQRGGVAQQQQEQPQYQQGYQPQQQQQQQQSAPYQSPQMQQQPEAPAGHRRGAGAANKSTYNILTGQ
jgi:hypothetical protein